MWSGWLSGAALWALATLALVAEQATCWSWSWGSVFILTYIFFGILVLFSLWPLVRYQRGFASKESAAVTDDADDPARERAHIDDDRAMLGADAGTVAFSLVESALLLAGAIVLARELDSQRGGGAPSVGATFGVAIAAVAVAALVFVVDGVRRACVRPRYVGGGADAHRFSTLFACCHTPAYDFDHTKRERAPACFGDYPLHSLATTLYNVTLAVGAALLIVSLALAIDFFNSSRPAAELGAVLWPAWTALGLVMLATLVLVAASLVDGSTRCYDVFVLGFSLVLEAALLWSSIWLLQAASLPPHVIATPLYVALTLTMFVFFVGQRWRCQASYRLVDTHDAHSTRRQDAADAAANEHSSLLADSADTVTKMAALPPATGSGIVSVRWPVEEDDGVV